MTMSPRTTTNDDVSSRDKEHQHQQPVLIISTSSAEEAEVLFSFLNVIDSIRNSNNCTIILFTHLLT